MWGRNDYGQIGDGTTIIKLTPIDITSQFGLNEGEQIVQMSMNMYHSSAITSQNRIFTWGRNNYGQLGNGTTASSTVPIDITSQFNLNLDERFINISLGTSHSSALTSFGRVFTWGGNTSGQLGDGTAYNSNTPVDITSKFSLNDGEIVSSISHNNNSSSAVTSDGRVFMWGSTYYGHIAYDSPTFKVTSPMDPFSEHVNIIQTDIYFSGDTLILPTMVLEGYVFSGWFSDIEMTIPFTLLEMPDENITLYGKWIQGLYTVTFYDDRGNILKSEIVISFESATAPTPPEKEGYEFLGWSASFDSITEDLDVYAVFSSSGEIEENLKVSAGGFGTVVLTDQNRIYATGRNDYGVFGSIYPSGSTTFVDISYVLNLSSGENIVDIVAGLDFIVVYTSTGRVLTWGCNTNGELGDGTFTSKSVAEDITANFGFHEGETVVMMEAYYYTILLTSEGRVFTWGRNDWGQLGNGNKTNQNLPVDITSQFALETNDKITFVTGGYWSSAVISMDGRVFTWGMNNHYQLANGNATSTIVPGEITSYFNLDISDKIIAITVGGLHGGAISESGLVFTWGDNISLIGDGTSGTAHSLPYNITSNFNFETGDKPIFLLGRWDSMHLLTQNGQVYGWGNNSSGMVGNLSTSPVYL